MLQADQQLWLRARCVGKTLFYVGYRHSHQLLWCPCKLPELLMGIVKLHSRVRLRSVSPQWDVWETPGKQPWNHLLASEMCFP